MTGAIESGWLIERRGERGALRLDKFRHEPYIHSNFAVALRFARKIDAESFLGWWAVDPSLYFVAEHSWG